MKPKNTICLWFDKDAHEAARFYAATFPDSKVTAVHEAPGDYPGGKKGDVLTVEFTVLGIPCLGLNGGPAFRHTEAFSFQIATENQEETDRYWNAIVGNGGTESQCGWCKDRWGLSWQIIPRALTDAFAAGGAEPVALISPPETDTKVLLGLVMALNASASRSAEVILSPWASVIITGGTHVPWAPCFHYLEMHWLPIMRQIGFDAQVTLDQAGFYPRGGGKISATIRPAREISPLDLTERGELQQAEVVRAWHRPCCPVRRRP